MEKLRYTVVLEAEDDGGYHAAVPALPGCHSQGDSFDEAMANIKEAIAAYVASLRAHGQAVPEDRLLIAPVEVAA